LSLVSFTQSDPSFSTAAGNEVRNWMGRPGAYAADGSLFLFGLVSVLFLPMLYAFASKLWRDAESEDTPHGRRWWRAVALLLLAMTLIGTTISLSFPGIGNLPASLGGIAGLLGAGAIRAAAGLLPEVARFWTILGLGIATLAGGAALAARVLAFDWAQLLTLPAALRRLPGREDPNPFKPRKEAARDRRPPRSELPA